MDGPPLSEDSWPDTQVDCVPRPDLVDALGKHLTITDPEAELRPGGVRGPVTELSRWGPGAWRRHAATSEQRPGEDRRSPSRTGMRVTLPVAP